MENRGGSHKKISHHDRKGMLQCYVLQDTNHLRNSWHTVQPPLRGYPWGNHAKCATVHITELAQTFHIGITWWSIGRYGISFVQASFFSFFRGGGTLEQPNLHWNMFKFCNFLNDNISGKLYSNPGETKFSQTTKYTLLNDDNIISVTLLY